MELFDLKCNIKDIFRESILLSFLEISTSLKKTCAIVCSEISFSRNSYHVKASKVITLQINWPISIWYDFLLKGVSEQTLSTATVINCKIILLLHDLNSTNQEY